MTGSSAPPAPPRSEHGLSVRLARGESWRRWAFVGAALTCGGFGAAWLGTEQLVLGLLAVVFTTAFALAAALLNSDVQRRANALPCLLLAALGPYAALGGDHGAAGEWAAAIGSFVFVPLIWLLLQYPGPRLPGLLDRLCLTVLAVACGQSLLSVAVQAESERPVWVLRARDTVLDVMLVVLLVAFVAVPLLLVRRLLAARGLPRRDLVPLVTASIVLALAFVVPEVLRGLRGAAAPTSIPFLLLLVVPGAFLTAAVLQRLARGRVAELVVELSRGADLDVRSALRRALSDPSLEVHYWAPEADAYVDGRGRPSGGPDAGAWVVEVRDSEDRPLARVLADRQLLGHADLVDAAVRAAALTLERDRLVAALRASERLAGDTLARLRDSEATEHRLSTLLPTGIAERLPGAATDGRTEELTVTVLMSDVRGYSQIAERIPATLLARLLHEHRQAVNAVVHAHGGTVMQYVGDAVMAVFGAPDPSPDHARQALRAASSTPPSRPSTPDGRRRGCRPSVSASASAPERLRPVSSAARTVRSTPSSVTP